MILYYIEELAFGFLIEMNPELMVWTIALCGPSSVQTKVWTVTSVQQQLQSGVVLTGSNLDHEMVWPGTAQQVHVTPTHKLS